MREVWWEVRWVRAKSGQTVCDLCPVLCDYRFVFSKILKYIIRDLTSLFYLKRKKKLLNTS